jgi:hypothetical protein
MLKTISLTDRDWFFKGNGPSGPLWERMRNMQEREKRLDRERRRRRCF